MAVSFEPSDRAEFILSDFSRDLRPVRVIFDGSEGRGLRITLEYFQDIWVADFEDVSALEPFYLVYRYDLLDLFDLFMISNDITSVRQEALLGSLCLLKEYAEIRVKELDKPGWRQLSNLPEATGRYMVGRFDGDELAEVTLIGFDAESADWSESPEGFEYWLDPKDQNLYSIPLPVLTDAEPQEGA